MLPLTRIRIVGPSMEPALLNNEWWLVRRGGRPAVGDVVLVVHPRRPDALIVKRLARQDGTDWWVLGDNADASEDSRQFGVVPAANVVGRLWWRYRPVIRRAG